MSTEERDRGVLLAAELAGDRGAARALSGFAAARAARVASLATGLEALPREARADAWRRAAAGLRRVAVEGASRLPPRARALLASEVPREFGERWLREAHPPRRGFVADEGLRAVVRAAATAAEGDVTPELVARARGCGRRLLGVALRGPSERAARALVATLDAEEAGAVLALAQLPAMAEPPEQAAIDAEALFAAALFAAAMRAAPPAERVIALGVMVEALTRPETDGDRRVRAWRRLARELASLGAVATRPSPRGALVEADA